MALKEKLKALGFEEVYEHGQYVKRDLDIYVYLRYNKIKDIQISKVWELGKFSNYSEYLSKVNYVLIQLESIIIDYNKGE
ncbi:MAG: hypothetical protein SPI06_01635 [Terrisporobacter sp.]|uniref:hypothetical protein n=1 Tax=Terrisporobacter sp. TaxID=1965305 RepID=UPI002A90C193|nr:hypothetical protein [Terrisporobacter sp.]MDY6152089.1 hypothetical protein [Terrisporobacter sp.]